MTKDRQMFEISYAYPTSKAATAIGAAKTGAYFICESGPHGSIVFHSQSWEDCRAYMDDNDLPEGRWSMSENPRTVEWF